MRPKTPTSKMTMNFPGRINQGLVRVQHWLLHGSAAIILMMMLATTYDIIVRYLGHPIEGVFEGVEVLLVIAVYLGLADVQYREKNVQVEMLVTRLPGKIRLAVEIFDLLLPIIVFTVVVWMTGTRAWQSFLMREATFKPAEHPVWIGRIVLTIGLSFLWLRLGIQIIQKFQHLTRRTGNSKETESN